MEKELGSRKAYKGGKSLLNTGIIQQTSTEGATYNFTDYGWNLCEHVRFYTLDLSKITQSKDNDV